MSNTINNKMELIRGTTPTIIINVKEQIDLAQVTAIWVYISQNKKILVDKELEDVSFDVDNRQIITTLKQEDTLNLKAGEALFQIRLLLNNGTALATIAAEITINEVYKGGVIKDE